MELNTALTLGSLFDGSGGFPLGGLLCGITPVWASEIEPFPIRVTTKRLPFMKHYGDISQMDGGKIEPVDIITFGSPCTDMSIAGRRAGLDGKQSVLFYQAIRIIQEMRDATHGKYPRYIVWENVPGAFSSNHGEDFKAVLEAVIGIKEPGAQVPMPEKNLWPYADLYMGEQWSVAYRTLDAQHWGVPQRRRRIFLVADFAGWGAGQVLFESEGLSGYSAEGFRAWQRTAGGAEEGAGAAGGRTDHRGGEDDGRVTLCINPQGNSGVGITEDKTLALVAQDHGNHPSVLQAAGFCTEHSAKARSIGYEEEKSPTLRAGVVPAALAVESNPTDSRVKISEDGVVQTLTQRMGTGGNNTPLVAQPEIRAFGVCSKSSHAMLSDNPRSGFYEAKVSRTLDQSGGNAVTSAQGGIAVVAPDPSYAIQGSMIGRTEKNGPQGDGVNEEVSFTLNTVDRHAVVAPSGEHYSASKNSHFTSAIRERANTLVATDYKEPPLVNDTPNEEPVYIVRRLTPVECARLQGFPDWWCDGLAIPEPTDEELAFWTGVWETWRKVTNPDGRPKTEKQIRKWLADPYTDSEEYRLWGNGVFLGNAYFVLAGVAWAAAKGG